MSLFQVIATLFALFMLYVVNIHRRKLQLNSAEQLFWYALWIAFIVIAIFPNLLLGVARLVRFERVFDLLVVGSSMVITTLVVTNYFLQRENNRKLEEVIRTFALKEADNDQGKSTK